MSVDPVLKKQQTHFFQIIEQYWNCNCAFWGKELQQKDITEKLGGPFLWCPWCGRELAEPGEMKKVSVLLSELYGVKP